MLKKVSSWTDVLLDHKNLSQASAQARELRWKVHRDFTNRAFCAASVGRKQREIDKYTGSVQRLPWSTGGSPKAKGRKWATQIARALHLNVLVILL